MEKLYKITDQIVSENKIIQKLIFNPGHKIFESHFPGNPILPGVIQLNIVKKILEQHAGKKLIANRISVKYPSAIIPTNNKSVTFEIDYKINGENIKANAKIFDKEKIYTKLKINLTNKL